MLFLLNEVVLNLDGVTVLPKVSGRRYKALSTDAVLALGRELYAKQPLLQRTRPDRARRLAALIAAKAPLVNAALFVAPTFDCRCEDVTVQLAIVDFDKMAELYQRQKAGLLDTVAADRRVWRRLAA